MSRCRTLLRPEMFTLTLVILLQGLGLVWPSAPLGMTVHVVPLESTQGHTVRAHFTAVVSGPCSGVTGLCADGDDCQVERNTVPFTGSKPGGGWCSHHWQKTLPANFTGAVRLGSSSQMFVALKANPVVRGNSGKLNHPAFVALPPPIRANAQCPHHVPLSVKDVDGDRVRCRFAREAEGECVDCEPHSFVELDQESCSVTFNGDAAVGEYRIYLMAEDVVPAPNIVLLSQREALSAVPFILSLTVEEAKHRCSEEPVATADDPAEGSVLHILPFHQRNFTVNYESSQESVVEVAVVGPPELFRVGFLSLKPLASLSIGWVRTENNLTGLLPVCFVANTFNLQSEPRCVWLHQREIMSLPTGTVLTCNNTEMNLVLPIGSFTDIDVKELQLNSPTCPVSISDSFLTARIPLEDCGTRAVHQRDELIYTNTLKTVHASTQVIRRRPVLLLPLACRVPGVQAKGPRYEIGIPKEKEVFGEVEFKLEFYLPGQGPLKEFTSNPVFRTDNMKVMVGRVKREIREDEDEAATAISSDVAASSASSSSVNSSGDNSSANATSSANIASSGAASNSTSVYGPIGSTIETLDLYVSSNCTVARAEIQVSSCVESETADFNVSYPLLDGGCTASGSTIEVVTTSNGTRIYRLNMHNMSSEGSTMYVRCTVNLCITTLPSQICPDPCTTKYTRANMVNSVFSQTYTITSDAVSLIYTTAPPATTTAATPTVSTAVSTATSAAPTAVATTETGATTGTTAATTVTTTTSHAAEKAPPMTVGLTMVLAFVLLQPFFN